jgi:hypothetical protein
MVFDTLSGDGEKATPLKRKPLGMEQRLQCDDDARRDPPAGGQGVQPSSSRHPNRDLSADTFKPGMGSVTAGRGIGRLDLQALSASASPADTRKRQAFLPQTMFHLAGTMAFSLQGPFSHTCRSLQSA